MATWPAGAGFCADAPQDNPIATYYGVSAGYSAWTDEIQWQKTINMAAYAQGANDFQKFENARDQLHAEGGGVLYYPAGDYDFKDAPLDGPNGRGLMLKKGVVIRGATPTGQQNAMTGALATLTTFRFPFQKKGDPGAEGDVPRDWNFIGLMPSAGEQLKDVDRVGVVWVEIVGGAIYFGPHLTWGASFGAAGSWKSACVKPAWRSRAPDGTHPLDPFCGGVQEAAGGVFVGAGRGRLVFGCKLTDSCVLNDGYDPGRNGDTPGYGDNGFYAYKFGPRIGLYGSRIVAANNLLPRSGKNFKFSQKTNSGLVKTLLFDYGKNYGLDVNKDLLGLVRYNGTSPGYFLDGVIVRDNWVFNHGHKGFSIGGQWVTIRNNHNDRAYLQEGDDPYGLGTGYELTIDGWVESQGGGSGSQSDNLSRAFDLGGQALWVDGNWFNNTGSAPGNDGEGILCQAHGGTQLRSWAVTRNTHEKGTGQTGYMGGFDVTHYGSLFAWNITPGWVGNAAGGRSMYDSAIVANAAAGGVSETDPDPNRPMVADLSGPLSAPADVQATWDGDHVVVTWTDTTDNEIGFRVDRSADNGATWIAVAYRPRRAEAVAENAPAWHDHIAPPNGFLMYRVAAIKSSETSEGLSAPVGVWDESIVPLSAGYNLIALPRTPLNPLTAEGLAQQITAQGGECTSVIAYVDGSFVTHPAGTAVNNFDILAGRGYFVRCAKSIGWTVRGRRFSASRSLIPLVGGYNLVGLPLEPDEKGKYSAESAGQEINGQGQGGGATSLIAYDPSSGQFVTHPVGTAVSNFTLELGRGYFIRCAKGSTWTVARR